MPFAPGSERRRPATKAPSPAVARAVASLQPIYYLVDSAACMRLRAACMLVLALKFWGAETETASVIGSRVPLFPPVSLGAAAVERPEGHAGVGRCQHAPPLSVCRRVLRLRGGAREATRHEEHDSDSLSSALVQMPCGHACSASGTGSAGGTDEGSSKAGTGEHSSDDEDDLCGRAPQDTHSLKRRMPARRVAHDEKRQNVDGRGVSGDGWGEEVAEEVHEEEGRGREGGGSEHILHHDMREEEGGVGGGERERHDAVNVLPDDEAESVSSSSSSSPLSSLSSSSGEFPTIEKLLAKAEKWEQEHMATQHKGGGGGGGGGEGMGEEGDVLGERDKGGGEGGGRRGGDEEAEWGFRWRVLPERYGRSLLTL
jgi:hypothetical protein